MACDTACSNPFNMLDRSSEGHPLEKVQIRSVMKETYLKKTLREQHAQGRLITDYVLAKCLINYSLSNIKSTIVTLVCLNKMPP